MAAGPLRSRVLVSQTVLTSLPPDELRAALSHEHAHLRRRDPLVKVLLSWASLAMLPASSAVLWSQFDESAEQASDAEAAAAHGPLVVASGLVSMARLVLVPTPAQAMAFGAVSLERRVRVLLDQTVEARPSFALWWGMAATVGAVAWAALYSEQLHHWVETIVHGTISL